MQQTKRSGLAVGVLVACAGLGAITTHASAQAVFQHTIGDPSTGVNENWQDIRSTRDGGSIAIGYETSPFGTSSRIFVMRTDPNGFPVWINRYDTPEVANARGYSITEIEDGFVLAAEVEFPGDLGLGVAKLDAAGGVVWSNLYTGLYQGDPIHSENAGPIIRAVNDADSGVETSITHRLFQTRWPSLLTLDPAGSIITHRYYVASSPRPECTATLSFTDHRWDPRKNVFQVTGSIRSLLIGNPADPGWIDIAYLQLGPGGGPVVAQAYDPLPSPAGDPEGRVDAFGHAIELAESADGSQGVVIAGPTTLGLSFFFGQTGAAYMLRVDGSPAPVAFTAAYQPGNPASVGFAALTAEDKPDGFVLAGRLDGSLQGMTVAMDAGLAPIWAHTYGDNTARLDAVDNNPDCGLWAAGSWTVPPTMGGTGGFDAWWLGTANGTPTTNCFDQPYDPRFEQNQVVRYGFELGVDSVDDVVPWELLRSPFPTEVNVLCNEPCCPADLAPPFGSLDIFDVLAFLNLFNAMDPAADLAPAFGTWDIFDVLAYLDLFDMGC